MRVLVTGGAGFIGSHTVDALVRDGHQVAVLDDPSTGRREYVSSAVATAFADVGSAEAQAFVASFRPSAVVHLAARISVRDSLSEPVVDARTNVLGTLVLLEACRKAGTSYVLFASSGAIYGTAKSFPIAEDEAAEPLSPYGCAKRAVEMYLGYYQRVQGLRWCSLRYANVYGPRQDPHGEAGVVAIFANRCLAGAPLKINGDGSQRRDYVYVEDVAAANLACLTAHTEGIYNVGTGEETSVTTVADRLLALSGSRAGVVLGPAVAGDPERSSLDATSLALATGWGPRTSLVDGLGKTWEWFRSQAARAERGSELR
jgi:UDP-glucose 4-epimerase